jgi:hypothetical protein
MNKRQAADLLKQIQRCCASSAKSHERLQQLEQLANEMLPLDQPAEILPLIEEKCGGFSGQLTAGMRRLHLRDHEAATALNVSRASVTRWRQGKIIPPLLMRQHVLAWLQQKLEKQDGQV